MYKPQIRVWDNREKEMIAPGDLPTLRKKDVLPKPPVSGGAIVNLCDLNRMVMDLDDGQLCVIDDFGDELYLSDERFTKMFPVGLTDDEDQMIFEGDIIEGRRKGHPYYILGEIVFRGCSFEIKPDYEKSVLPPFLTVETRMIDYWNCRKILGNIFEGLNE